MNHDVYVNFVSEGAEQITAEMKKILQFLYMMKGMANGTIEPLKQLGNQTSQVAQKTSTLSSRIKDLFLNSRKMFMGFLSLMFAAQMVKKSLTGLIKPALKMSEKMDLITATLQVVFLPTAMVLLKFLMPIFQYLMELSTPVKLLIGLAVIFAIIFMMVIAALASFALAVVGIISLGWELTLVMASIAYAIAAFFVSVLAYGAIQVFAAWLYNKIVAGMTWLYDTILKPLAGMFTKYIVDPLMDKVFNPLWAKIEKPVMKIVNWLKDKVWTPLADWFSEKFIEPFQTAWNGLITFLINTWNKFAEPIKNFTGKDWTIKRLSANAGAGEFYDVKNQGQPTSSNASLYNAPTNNFNISSGVDAEIVSKKLSEDTNDGFLGLVRSWLT